MIGKNNHYLRNTKDGTKVESYSIKKFKVGTASVVIGASIFFGAGAVAQASEEVSNNTTADNTTNAGAKENVPTTLVATAQPVAKETTKEDVAAGLAARLGGEAKALDKTKLENYIAEIEAKLADGTYANKTEESVAVLKDELKAAKDTLENATTQEEITKAYSKLVTTANTKLKAKPVEKKETPAVDTTEGKETVGKKAENTEKKSESNSIENTGSNDPRNGQAIPTGVQFRAEIAYAPDANGTAYGKTNSYITSGVNGSSNPTTAQNVTSKVMTYKTRYNTDSTGKITSIDWLVFFNDYLENFDREYGIKGEVFRNYIQIPKEVNMPTSIKRLKYTAKRKFGRPEFADTGAHMSDVVTFDNPEPGMVNKVPLSQTENFSRDSWNSYTRGYDTLSGSGQMDFYFKDAAKVSSTRALIEANALPGNRVIWDQSNTAGNLRDGFVWEFRTEVPDTTTNEQLKNMKAVIGMFRTGTAGVDHGLHTFATNPVNLSQSDINPPLTADQTVNVGEQPDAKKSISNFDRLPVGTKAVYTTAVNTSNPGTVRPTVRVTYPDGSTVEGPVNVIVKKEAVAPAKPVIETSLTGKAGTKTPVVVNAEAGSTVELFDKDNRKIGEGTAGDNDKVSIIPSANIPVGNVTAKATKSGKTSVASDAAVATLAVAPTVSIPFSDPTPDKKDIYIYNGEEVDIDITFNDDSGKIQSAALKRGGNIALKDIGENKQDNEWGLVTTVIKNETTTPATIKITGTVTGVPDNKIPKTESQALPIVSRFATATDLDGAYIENQATKFNAGTNVVSESYKTDPGAFTITLKAQTAKYDIKTPASADKVTVSDANNISNEDFEKIKAKVKIEYSNNNIDMRLADKKGKEVENPTERVESITREGNNVVVTYKDGSKDTKALADFVNVAPKVALPYSNEANKQIYVYTGENTDLTFKGTDENEVKDLYLRGPGDITWNNANQYGFTTGKVEDGAVTGEGSVSEDKTSATIKMTGTTNLAAGKEWTSFIVSKDNDGKLSNEDYRALDKDPNAKEKPGYARFVVKNQTSKYDIATPTEKVAVADPANVTADDLAKIKEKLQIEYAKTNDDANFADKKGKTVDAEDAKTKIKSVEKDANGNLVVTYTDGSKDTRSLSDFVAKNPEVTPVKDPANLTDAEKEKVKEAVKKANPTAAKVEVGNDGTTTVTFPDGSTASLTPEKTAKTADSNALVDPEVTPVKDPANLTDAEKEKVKEAVKKANPTATKVEVGKDGTATVTFPDGSTAEIPAAKAVEKAKDAEGVKDPAKTSVKDPANLTDAEKAKVEEAAKKANPTATKVEVGNDGTATVTFPDGSTGSLTPEKQLKQLTQMVL